MHEVRPNVGVPAIYRYETKPGVQAQVDWAECGYIEIDGEKRKLYCFTMVLGYSRIRYAEFTLQIDVFTLIQCHINAFGYFGSYPQELLYDNITQIVKKTSPKIIWFHLGFPLPGLLRALRIHSPALPSLSTPDQGKNRKDCGICKEGLLHGRQFYFLHWSQLTASEMTVKSKFDIQRHNPWDSDWTFQAGKPPAARECSALP